MPFHLVALGLFVFLMGVSDAGASGRTARDKDDLIGPVRSVVTMTPGFSESETYDRTGRLIEAVTYEQRGNSSTRYVFTYDERGALQEELAYEAGLTLLYHKQFAYAQDSSGRQTAVVAAYRDGEFHDAEFSTYDRSGRLSETLHTDGTLASRNLFDVLGRILYSARYRDGQLLGELAWTYDGQGRWLALTSYDPGGAVTGKVVHEYDVTGRRSRTTTEQFRADRPGRWITTYEYDGAGNWIKEQTVKEAGTPAEADMTVSPAARMRVIDYYDTR